MKNIHEKSNWQSWIIWILIAILLFHIFFGDTPSIGSSSRIEDLEEQVNELEYQIEDLQISLDDMQTDMKKTWSNLNEESSLYRAYPSVSGCLSC